MSGPAPETALVPTAAVEELLRTLVKGLRAFQMYLPNNPMYQRGEQAVRAAFQPVWGLTEELVLTIQETDFVWEDQVVYHQPAKNESLAWTLFKDGMRVVTLRRGVEAREIIRFLDRVQAARNLAADAGDDLYTLLWEESFEFISYHFAEMVTDQPLPGAPIGTELAGGPATGQEEVSARREAVRTETAEETQRRPGMVDLEEFDSTLYWLDETEVRYITDAVDQEYKQDLRANTLAILLDLLEQEPEAGVRVEVLAVLESLLAHLLNSSDFRSVALILREFRVVLQRVGNLSEEQRKSLAAFTAHLSEPGVLGQLLQALDETSVAPVEDDLNELFREFRAEALPTLLTWLPKLVEPRTKRLVEAAADRLAAENPREVLQLLRTADEESLVTTVDLCRRLKLQPAIPGLSEALSRGEAPVRLAAVQAMIAIGTPGALQHVERAVDDPDREVRLATVRELGKRGYKGILRRIEPVVQSKAPREIDLTERMAFFEAFALIAGEGALPTLQSLLSSAGFFRQKEAAEIRACAALAIGRTRAAAARDILQRAQGDKELVVRNAIARALRELGQ
ncbi:MAG: HEAT repeat domain-containing protein [Gemmatimonadales bacterium]